MTGKKKTPLKKPLALILPFSATAVINATPIMKTTCKGTNMIRLPSARQKRSREQLAGSR